MKSIDTGDGQILVIFDRWPRFCPGFSGQASTSPMAEASPQFFPKVITCDQYLNCRHPYNQSTCSRIHIPRGDRK
jgi:hypothetical protein